jgi:AcrR family transcriptional regulator
MDRFAAHHAKRYSFQGMPSGVPQRTRIAAALASETKQAAAKAVLVAGHNGTAKRCPDTNRRRKTILMYQVVHQYLYHMVHWSANENFVIMPRKKDQNNREHLLEACLAAFLGAGTLDLSLDGLAKSAKTSKRMLIHYFGTREALEEQAMTRLEDRLRARFRAGVFPAGTPLRTVVSVLWDQITAPQSRGVLQLTMDLTRRSWSGSMRGKRFFEEQQRLWFEMLHPFLADTISVETLLQLFQGAALVYLVTGDRERGRRALDRLIEALTKDALAKDTLSNPFRQE